MEGRWCSAADVAADVSRAGGGQAPPAPRRLADACLAWGARPGPLLTECAPAPPAAPAGPAPAPPDLRGITRMLRMVRSEDADEVCHADIVITRRGGTPPARRPAPPRAGPLASDLNPHVPEFVPRGAAGGGGGGGDREALAARLQSDIQAGRDTGGAIARLMRLYAQPAPAPAPAPAPRLLTPDYFERSAAPAPPDLHDPPLRSVDTGSDPIPAAGSDPPPGAHPLDVRASVDKVRRWLGDEEEAPPARSPPLLLHAPVTFRSRRPGGSSPRSPLPAAPAPPAPAPAARAYSPPPERAAALQREYAARAAAALSAAPPPPAARDTLWARLEAPVRARDTLWARLEAPLLAREAALAAPAPAPAPAEP